MNKQALFWFVHATDDGQPVNVAVAAFTERQAHRQARKCLGLDARIGVASPVRYAHAWVMDLIWLPKRQRTLAALDPADGVVAEVPRA